MKLILYILIGCGITYLALAWLINYLAIEENGPENDRDSKL